MMRKRLLVWASPSDEGAPKPLLTNLRQVPHLGRSPPLSVRGHEQDDPDHEACLKECRKNEDAQVTKQAPVLSPNRQNPCSQESDSCWKEKEADAQGA